MTPAEIAALKTIPQSNETAPIDLINFHEAEAGRYARQARLQREDVGLAPAGYFHAQGERRALENEGLAIFHRGAAATLRGLLMSKSTA